ncbi:MAG: HlyD family efflux transporter periplasmic adaptor subunit [Oceanicaulis sp.]|nr:HlyD family efflux transporter periplasmic adaptor subunit [Oceanicaulis sp.]
MAHHAGPLIAGVILLSLSPGCGPGEGAGPPGAERTLVVEPQSFEVTLGFTGRIGPGEHAELLAPFDGVITAVHAGFGDRVMEGEPLVSLNPFELERERVEAEAALLRAQAEAGQLLAWADGLEMSRARRDVASAEAALADLERRLGETESLLERGLVPRIEFEGLVQRRGDLRRQRAQAREQLEATRQRGEGARRRIALLELDLARERLDRIEADLARAVLRAPVAGVVVRPPGKEAETGPELRAGAYVTRGRSLLLIARPDGLNVSFQLDEADVNALAPGAPVRVTGPGFPGVVLSGSLTRISGQAEPGSSGQNAAFAAVARLDPPPQAGSSAVRIGMTADIQVVVFHSDAALVIPSEAVEGAPSDAWVRVRAAPGAPVRRVRVELEAVGPNRVALRSGVSAGDTVVWRARE